MTSQITIRPAQPEDAPVLLSIYAPYVENTAITFEYDVPSTAEFAQRIQNTLTKFPYLVAEKNGKIVGYAYVSPFKSRAAYDWSVETSVYVDKNFKSQGIGKSLYQMLEKILKAQHITNLNACIASPIEEDVHLTKDSIYFHERLGYNKVGMFHKCGYKFNTWYDMLWMEKHLANHPTVPEKVLPFSKVYSQFFS